MAAVQQNADLGRELSRERTDRNRELAVIDAARQMKVAFLAFEERRALLEGFKITPKEKSMALEPYRSGVQEARRVLFDALEQLEQVEGNFGETEPPPRLNGG